MPHQDHEMQPALTKLRSILASEASNGEKQQAVCRWLHDERPHYDWVGFYIARPAQKILKLGPYVGAPTEHTRIPYGRGICGQVADSEETLVIDDVGNQENYLACSMHVKSELVVPIFKDGCFVAELDIDSHTKSRFGAQEVQFLESVAKEIAVLF